MTTEAQPMNDLRARVLTGLVMAAVGLAFVWQYSWVMLAMLSAVAAAMVTELFLMLARERYLYASIIALFAAAGVWFSGRDSFEIALVFFAVVAVIGVVFAPPNWRGLFPFYALIIGAGGLSAFWMRDNGLITFLWLILIAVAVDVAGYFAGRMIGGPKLWPAVSPKKTWSGTIAGWLAAGLVGALIGPYVEMQHTVGFFILFSVVLAIGAQGGDLLESAIKRRAGVKDASSLLPGHGGMLDRFDGMIVVFLLANLAWQTGIL